VKETLDFYTRSLDCVHCGLCLEACPTYGVLGLETDSPRGRIYLMRAMAEGRIDDVETIRPHLDQCLDCRACETACPSGVRYGQILETVKSDLEERRPKRGFVPWLTRFLLAKVVAHQGRLRLFFRFARLAEVCGLRWLAARLGLLPKSMDALVPHVPPAAERRPLRGTFRPSGTPRGRVALFTGCVMEQVFGRINLQTRDLLVDNGFEVVVPERQVCCGALLIHNGQRAEARGLARRNVEAFAGFDAVITNSAGCGAALREYGDLLDDETGAELGRRCVDVTAFLAERGLSAEPARREVTVAYDAPCHLCHAQGVHDAPLALLRKVPGLRLAPNPRAEDCCGSAGIYNLLHPELAAEIGRRKAADLIASGASLVATGNPGCMMQIGAHLRAMGSTQQVVHPVELLLPDEDRR
jgi:glycolate oxidase iron-sulfur subunit